MNILIYTIYSQLSIMQLIHSCQHSLKFEFDIIVLNLMKVQERLHAELDSVVGRDRLPSLEVEFRSRSEAILKR